MLNSSIIMGRIVKTPELKTTQSGVSVTSFTVAVERSYVKQGEERQTDFIPVVAWRNNAEFICKWFTKGQMIALQGSLQTRKYEHNGENRTVMELIVEKAGFCGDKKENNADDGEELPF